MKRRLFSELANCDPMRLDNFTARKQLPFLLAPLPELGSGAAEKARRRADYSVSDAFEMRLMLDFMENGGVDVDSAKYAAGNSWRKLAWQTHGQSRDDLYLVLVQERDFEGMRSRQLFAGTLNHIPEIIREHTSSDCVQRIVLVNASEVSRKVLETARDLEIISEDEVRDAWLLRDVY